MNKLIAKDIDVKELSIVIFVLHLTIVAKSCLTTKRHFAILMFYQAALPHKFSY